MMRDRWQYVAATVAIAAGLSGLAAMGPDHVADATPVQTVFPGDTLTASPDSCVAVTYRGDREIGTRDVPCGEPATQQERIQLAFATFPACEYEDSRDCAWDASERGNGRGHSFVDIGGRVFYVDGWDGKR